jgi:hypothetical protein
MHRAAEKWVTRPAFSMFPIDLLKIMTEAVDEFNNRPAEDPLQLT